MGNPGTHEESEMESVISPGIEIVSASNSGHYVNTGTSFVASDV